MRRKVLRGFGPSVIAVLAGVSWMAIAILLPSVEAKKPRAEATVDAAASPGPCTAASLIAHLPELPEASGLALSRHTENLLWSHNDSGQPLLYAVGTDGKLRGRLRVSGATVDDWEDIATGPCARGSCLFIADIGDNKQSRPHVVVYRMVEPSLGDAMTERVEAFYGAYPDGAKDAEGFFVGPSGTLFIVTKGEGSPVSIYRFPAAAAAGSVARLERVTTLAGKVRKDQRVTDADISPDGRWIALRTLDSVAFYRAPALLAGTPEPPIEVDVSRAGETQGEGVALMRDGTVFLAGESSNGLRGGTLARMSCKLP